MPRRNTLHCYFRCKDDGPLHSFPKPTSEKWEDIQKFNTWKSVLHPSTRERGNNYIYNCVRFCNRHFLKGYCLPSNKLTKNAVPTLCLVPENRSKKIHAIMQKQSNGCDKPSRHITKLETNSGDEVLITQQQKSSECYQPTSEPKNGNSTEPKVKVSAAQTSILCNFFEQNPEVIRGYKRTSNCMDAVQNKWKNITLQLNAAGPPRDYKSWAKYLCDMKAKLKRKRIKWRQSSNDKNPIICNADDFNEIRLRMLQVLRKDNVSHLNETQETYSLDIDSEDEDIDNHNEDQNIFMDILPDEILEEQPTSESLECIEIETPTNDSPPTYSEISQVNVDDSFDQFSKYIAEQLRSFPSTIAIETQHMLLAIIKQQKLKVLNETSSSADPLS